jgi:hypothetical protein
LVNIIDESSAVFSDAIMNKLANILTVNGKKTDSGNYRVDGLEVAAYYSPKNHRIVAMDALWGAPKYVYDDGSAWDEPSYYKMNSEGRKAKLTKSTFVKAVMKALGTESIDNYNDNGSKA